MKIKKYEDILDKYLEKYNYYINKTFSDIYKEEIFETKVFIEKVINYAN